MGPVWNSAIAIGVLAVLFVVLSGWRKSVEQEAIREFFGGYCDAFYSFSAFDEDGKRMTDFEEAYRRDCREIGY